MKRRRPADIDVCMRRPLALPPGRGGVWLRRLPKVVLGMVYGLGFIVFAVALVVMIANDVEQAWWRSLALGTVCAYLMFGLLLLLLPAVVTATVLSFERDRGTMEAVVLTPMWHDEIARGRFWHAAWPWLRLFVWMLPVYLVMAVSLGGTMQRMDGRELAGLSVAYLFVPKFYVTIFTGMGIESGPGVPCWTLILVMLRALRDIIDLMAVLGISYYFSARMWRGVHAIILSMVTVPALMASLFLAPEWLMMVTMTVWSFTRIGGAPPMTLFMTLYAIAGVSVCVLQLWMCSALVRRVARSFDRYALGHVRGL